MFHRALRMGGAVVIFPVLLALASLPADARRRDASRTPAPSPEEVLYQKALADYRSGNLAAAASALEKGAQDYPRNTGLATLLGWTRLRQSNLAGARRAFESALAADPKAADARSGLGYTSLREHRSAEAEANFLKAVQLEPGNAEAWKGLGMTRRNREDMPGAREALQEALRLNPKDAEARDLLAQVTGTGAAVEERRPRGKEAAGKPLSVVARAGRGRLEVREGEGFRPIFIKGINLGTALPGKFPAEFPDDPVLYRRWFDQMGALGLNVVRLYTLHPPSLYRALREHNRERPQERLRLVQGVWTELPENDDYDDPAFMNPFREEVRRVIDAIHGNIEIPAHPGHARGLYDADVSDDLLAFLLGREWEPYSVVAYEEKKPGRPSFAGEFMKALPGARPFESWLASICDLAAGYETEHYREQHPVGYVSWPTLDPLHHPTEATAAEETAIRRKRGEKLSEPIKEYDNDAVDIDAMHIAATPEFPAGFFASYHAYPYYPEFMILDPGYARARDAEGPSHYFGYLKDLKAHHQDQPVIIAEFGVPTSRGIAHLQPEGQHHGGHTTPEQGKIDARLFRDIHDAGLGGGILFSWMDEWFKKNWLVMAYEVPAERKPLWLNALDAEENYGLLAAWPGRPDWKIVLDGKGEDWTGVKPLYIDDAPPGRGGSAASGFRHLRGFRVASDEAYLYLRLDLDPGQGPVSWSGSQYWVGIDTYDAARGEHRFPPPVDVTTPAGMEFLIEFSGPDSRILVDRPYDLFTNRNRRPYRSVEGHGGDFMEIQVYTNRDRYGRDGTYYPAQGYSRSPLRRGSMDPASPDYDTLSDWIDAPDGSFLEARIAWGLLNVTDPSSHQVVHEDAPRTGPVATRRTDGFRFFVLGLEGGGTRLKVVDRFPRTGRPSLSDFPVYRWDGWKEPRYHLVLKDSYEILKQALKAIPEHDDEQ
jgi:tetratricopeptide (TPR) repeat protein